MTLHMEDVHGIATKIYEYEIEAGMLCSAIEKVPIDGLNCPWKVRRRQKAH